MLLLLYIARYLLSVLTTKEMPKEEEEFFENLKVYFPNIYDVKFMMGDVNLWVERCCSFFGRGEDWLSAPSRLRFSPHWPDFL